MSKIRYIFVFAMFFSASAAADVWMWKDANGKTHYVETNKAIFTWLDDSGKVYYSDSPDHVDAVAVQLIWVSKGTIRELNQDDQAEDEGEFLPETEAERIERETKQAHACKRATEIYDSYINAPRLYKTNKKGEKEYLSDREAKKEIAETKAKKDELCK